MIGLARHRAERHLSDVRPGLLADGPTPQVPPAGQLAPPAEAVCGGPCSPTQGWRRHRPGPGGLGLGRPWAGSRADPQLSGALDHALDASHARPGCSPGPPLAGGLFTQKPGVMQQTHRCRPSRPASVLESANRNPSRPLLSLLERLADWPAEAAGSCRATGTPWCRGLSAQGSS